MVDGTGNGDDVADLSRLGDLLSCTVPSVLFWGSCAVTVASLCVSDVCSRVTGDIGLLACSSIASAASMLIYGYFNGFTKMSACPISFVISSSPATRSRISES